MTNDFEPSISGYLSLLEELKRKTGDAAVAVAVMHELAKDRRMAMIRAEKASMAQSSERPRDVPMTDKQRAFLRKLGVVNFSDKLRKHEASLLIDEVLAMQQAA